MTTTLHRPAPDLYERSVLAVRAAMTEHADKLEPLEMSREEDAWTVASTAKCRPGASAPLRMAIVVPDGDRLSVHMHDLARSGRAGIRSRRFRTGRGAARAALAFVTDLPAGTDPV